MNPAFKLLLVLIGCLLATEVGAAEWRGIKPLSSTREDVVRLFGECLGNEEWCEFSTNDEDVIINFSGGNSCNNLPAGTVLSMQRELRNATTFETLQLDKRRFKSFDPAIPRNIGYRGFIDEKSGLLLKTLRGEVFQINYIPPKKDWQVCPAYYRHPRDFVEVVTPHVLVISFVGCPEISPVAGQKVTIKAHYERTGQRFGLLWETSEGRIIDGQNTGTIVLDTKGLEGKTITITVELNDSSHHTATATCSFQVAPAQPGS